MTTERDQFVFALAIMLMILIALSLLALVAIFWLDYTESDVQPVCDSTTGVAIWTYEKRYARDMTRIERMKWCPRWTMTPYPHTPTPTFTFGTNP